MENKIITDEKDSPEGLVLSEIENGILKRNKVGVEDWNRVIQLSFGPITNIIGQIFLRDIKELISSAIFKSYGIAPEEITVHTNDDDKTIFIVTIPKGY